MHDKNVTQELKHLIPSNTLGLTYDLTENARGELIFEVSRNGRFLGLTHLWRFWGSRAANRSNVRPRHINSAIKRLQNKGTIRMGSN